MRNFKLGALDEWSALDLSRPVIFKAGKPRHVQFEVMAAVPCEVYAVEPGGDDRALLAVGDGHLVVSFTIGRDTAVVIAAPEGATVYLRTHDRSHLVEKSGGERYTRLHVAKPPSEYERLLQFARMNQLHMEQRLQAEVGKVRAELGARPKEKPVAPRLGRQSRN